MSTTLNKLAPIFGELRTLDEVEGAMELLRHRLSEIGAENMRAAVDRGFVPQARVRVRKATGKNHDRFVDKKGVIDGVNTQSFTVLLDSRRRERFVPDELELLAGSV